MERGETRVEKAGAEWHVYRQGHLTDYFIGTVVKINSMWRASGEERSPVDEGRFRTRKAAIAALCKLDDYSANGWDKNPEAHAAFERHFG